MPHNNPHGPTIETKEHLLDYLATGAKELKDCYISHGISFGCQDLSGGDLRNMQCLGNNNISQVNMCGANLSEAFFGRGCALPPAKHLRNVITVNTVTDPPAMLDWIRLAAAGKIPDYEVFSTPAPKLSQPANLPRGGVNLLTVQYHLCRA